MESSAGDSPKTEKDPGKVMKPVGGSRAGTEGGLLAVVETLHQVVGLRMIGGGGLVGDIEEATEVKPKGGGELGTPVRSNDGGIPESGDPGVNEGGCTVGGGGGRERDSFRPADGAVNDGEEIGIARGGRQGAN